MHIRAFESKVGDKVIKEHIQNTLVMTRKKESFSVTFTALYIRDRMCARRSDEPHWSTGLSLIYVRGNEQRGSCVHRGVNFDIWSGLRNFD